MADTDIEGEVTARGRAQGLATSVWATPAEYDNVAALRTRLTAINGSYFTAARLNQMTKNDMVMAVRQSDDPLTI